MSLPYLMSIIELACWDLIENGIASKELFRYHLLECVCLAGNYMLEDKLCNNYVAGPLVSLLHNYSSVSIFFIPSRLLFCIVVLPKVILLHCSYYLSDDHSPHNN